MSKIQIIKYKCCGKVFAACCEPDCYTDEEWLTNLKNYINRGDIVEMVESETSLKLDKCECKNTPKQLLIPFN